MKSFFLVFEMCPITKLPGNKIADMAKHRTLSKMQVLTVILKIISR